MKKIIVDFMESNPIIAGIIFLIIALILFVYQINKKEKYNLWSPHGLMSWKEMVGVWALILMSVIFAIILFFRN